MSIRIYPYTTASESARLLAKEMKIKMIKPDRGRSRYIPNRDDMVINWGATTCWFPATNVKLFLNEPMSVHNVSNKLRFFRTHNHKFNHPHWTINPIQAEAWLQGGNTVVVRHELAGNGGSGIEIIEPGQEVPLAPLYTKYIPKAAEYRVHIVDTKMIDIQQKVKRQGVEGNFKIRTHDNGFVFARTVNDRPVIDTVPPCVVEQAVLAVTCCDLDFGGVDVIYNRRENEAYVLEVNSAPGIEGTTVKSYAKAFKELEL